VNSARLWLSRLLTRWATRVHPWGYSIMCVPCGPVPKRLIDEEAETQ
jgi:hypothetical protein